MLDRTGVVWIMNITEAARSRSVAFQNNSSILITPFSIYLKLISKIGGPHGARSAFSRPLIRVRESAVEIPTLHSVGGEFLIRADFGAVLAKSDFSVTKI